MAASRCFMFMYFLLPHGSVKWKRIKLFRLGHTKFYALKEYSRFFHVFVIK